MIIKTFKLRDGSEIPVIGLGTGLIKHVAANYPKYLYRLFKEKVKGIIKPEFKKNNKYPLQRDRKKDIMVPKVMKYYLNNYENTFIDTARAYVYAEEELGKIINENNKPFIVSKVTNYHQRENKVLECVKKSLSEIGVDSLDVCMLHWPQTNTFVKSYGDLIECKNKGLIKRIGVANFNMEHLEELKKNGYELPLVNEFECHPYLQQKDLVKYCKENGIQVIAYAPTGHKISEFSNLERIKKICTEKNVLPSQVIMRWHYQNGIIPIFNTTSIEHLKENLDIFNFNLSEEEMEYINSLDRNERYWPDPANCDFNKL